MFMDEDEARSKLVEIGRKMYLAGYVVTNDGNISIRLSESLILITPTGVSKGEMQERDMVVMDLCGNVVKKGDRKPTSEAKMHLRIYRDNKDVGAVVHAHPIYATCFAIQNKPIDRPYLMEAIMQLGVVPCAAYAKQGTSEVADSIAPYCKDYVACLLANHGALTWGHDIDLAYTRLEVLENTAHINYLVDLAGGASGLLQNQIDDLGQIMQDNGKDKLTLPKQL